MMNFLSSENLEHLSLVLPTCKETVNGIFYIAYILKTLVYLKSLDFQMGNNSDVRFRDNFGKIYRISRKEREGGEKKVDPKFINEEFKEVLDRNVRLEEIRLPYTKNLIKEELIIIFRLFIK